MPSFLGVSAVPVGLGFLLSKQLPGMFLTCSFPAEGAEKLQMQLQAALFILAFGFWPKGRSGVVDGLRLRQGWALVPCYAFPCQAVAPRSEHLWAGDANSPVIYLQEGEVCLGCDLPLLILCGVGVLK